MRSRPSVRDRLRFADISWLMPRIDVEAALARLQVRISERCGDEIWGWCPDHHLFVREPNGSPKEPSHPKWSVNVTTGQTNCYTEGRGSNLLWLTSRLRDCSAKEAMEWLTCGITDAEAELLRNDRARRAILQPTEDKQRGAVRGLKELANELANPHRSQRLYDFFMRPPGRPPTNILPATVNHFQVVERTWGFYLDRAIIPHFDRAGDLVGFCAIDLLGEAEWLRRHPDAPKEAYKKVLYPANFPAGSLLFGEDEVASEAEELILVEAARERMKLWQEGYPEAVGMNGTSICGGHIETLGKLCPKRVVVMFDGDPPGRKATILACQKLVQFSAMAAFLPDGVNPKNLSCNEIAAALASREEIDAEALHWN